MANETETDVVDSTSVDSAVVEQTPDELRAELAAIKREKEDTAKALKKANDESKTRRLRLEELERLEDERAQSKLSDEEKHRRAAEEQARKAKEAESEVIKLREELLTNRINEKVKDEARKKDFMYPELVPAMIGRDKVVIDEDGEIKGVDKAIERLAKDFPGLLTASSGGGSPQAIRQRQSAQQNGPRMQSRAVDPYEQELIDLGRGGGRM